MMMIMEGSESPRSPEAKLGLKVEDLWDTQEPQLTPTQKLNACFESIPVSSFPLAPSQGIYLVSYSTVFDDQVCQYVFIIKSFVVCIYEGG